MKRPALLGALVSLAISPHGVSAGVSPASPNVIEEASWQPASAHAVLARSFEELAALVRDPSGPREIRLAPIVYRGDLTIERPVTIVGEPRTALEGTGNGTVVTVSTSDVALRGMAIRRSGRRSTTEDAGIKATGDRIRVSDVDVSNTLFGVTFAACHSCVLERAHVSGSSDPSELRGDGIKLWESNDSIVRDSVVEDARDVVVWYTKRALVERNIVRRGRYGTHFMYAHDSIARKNRLEGDTVGIFVMYSARLTIEDNVIAGARGPAGIGLGFKESDAVQARRNWLVADTTGTYLDFSPRTPDQPVVFENNVFALDDVALRLHSVEKGAVIRGNDFRDDGQVVEVDGGGDALGCIVHGNHFTDYEGYDLDGDGIGDVPFRVDALSSELTDSRPDLRFFHGTPAMNLLDVVARAVPVLDSKTLLVDDAPVVRFPEVSPP